MKNLLVSAVFLLSSLPAFAGENCTCKYHDMNVPEGQTVCLQTPKGSQMATCVKVLNNTSWKFLGSTCPTAQLTKPVQNFSEPVIDFGAARKLRG